MIADYLKFVWSGLQKRKLRSWLTILGILIGVTAVIALISLGNGMNAAIGELFSGIGNDKIFVSPGGMFMGPTGEMLTSAKIDDHDRELIENVRGVEQVIGLVTRQAKIKFGEQTKYASVVAAPTDSDTVKLLDSISFYKVGEGRQIKNGDRFKADIGFNLARDMFDKEVQLSDNIDIEGQMFQVVGIQEKSGSPIHDNMVRIPIDTGRELFGIPDEYSMFIVKVKEGSDPAVVAENIKETMRDDRNLDAGKEDFSVELTANVISGVGTILSVVQIALIGIASISIIVGGIGIMNTTYTSVTERTKEIGILKAVGAQNRDIVIIFLIEAGILGLVGGALGVALGTVLAKAVELAAANLGADILKAALSPGLIIGSLVFSFGVGALSGVLPALKAAKMNIVEAISRV
ncbi:MAG: ABC transporter permease [Candidatus Nanoarchaeia archaeon]|nr:ABC transporter permease [Candidatus Nanoarchaeia archaeon]MDD5239853.1 ABC transporter permease [Candidatus Nanoarchaeia archaeon]